MVEYRERSPLLLELSVVAQSTPPGNQRYRVIKHHGAAHVSVPRPWLRDKIAQSDDVVDVFQDPADQTKLVLTLRRFWPNGVSHV
jgi:hypothetical protein